MNVGPAQVASRAVLAGCIVVSTAVAPTLAAELSPVQARLIALLTYIHVSRDRCGHLVGLDSFRKVAADVSGTFVIPEQVAARDEGCTAAEQQFRCIHGPVECPYALARLGPNGSEMPGMIGRKEPNR